MKAIKVFPLAQFTGNRLIKKSHDMIIMGLTIMILCLLISAVILRNNDGSTTLRAVLSLLVTVMHDPFLTLGTRGQRYHWPAIRATFRPSVQHQSA